MPISLHASVCIVSAVFGSSEVSRCFFQSRFARAVLSFLSRSAAPFRPLAMSAAWAAIFAAITPWRTSSAFGSPRCSFGVT